MKIFAFMALALSLTAQAYGSERSFQVHTSKKITPDVERFYGRDGNAFATVFCRADAQQVMMVDSRMRDLDGKTFYFASLQACLDAKTQARRAPGCKVELVINTQTLAAGSRVLSCN